jgi:hypothetical protein
VAPIIERQTLLTDSIERCDIIFEVSGSMLVSEYMLVVSAEMSSRATSVSTIETLYGPIVEYQIILSDVS